MTEESGLDLTPEIQCFRGSLAFSLNTDVFTESMLAQCSHAWQHLLNFLADTRLLVLPYSKNKLGFFFCCSNLLRCCAKWIHDCSVWLRKVNGFLFPFFFPGMWGNSVFFLQASLENFWLKGKSYRNFHVTDRKGLFNKLDSVCCGLCRFSNSSVLHAVLKHTSGELREETVIHICLNISLRVTTKESLRV